MKYTELVKLIKTKPFYIPSNKTCIDFRGLSPNYTVFRVDHKLDDTIEYYYTPREIVSCFQARKHRLQHHYTYEEALQKFPHFFI